MKFFSWKYLCLFAVLSGFLYFPTAIASGEERFVVSYGQDGRYIVDEFVQAPGHLQERVSHHVYNTRAEAQKFLSARYSAQELAQWKMTAKKASAFEPQFVTETDDELLWEETNAWSFNWEKRYAEWVENNITPSFFYEHKIATDCADVAIALRWIFARIYSLPMGSRLAGSNGLLTHRSMKKSWMDLPTAKNWYEDRRFLTALDYVLDNTYTGSLSRDSYPIAITPENFLAGAHHLDLYENDDSGHTRLFYQVDSSSGELMAMASTTPREVRDLWPELFFQYEQYDYVERGGFLRMRWLEKINGEWKLRAPKDMPGYSLEQYASGFAKDGESFDEAVLRRMATNPISPKERMKSVLDTLHAKFLERVDIVKNGYAYCLKHDCAEGTQGYEDWGTHSRDGRILNLIEYSYGLRSYYHDSEAAKLWDDYYYDGTLRVDSDRNAYISSIMNAFWDGKISHDPRESIRKRWGL